MKSDIGTPVDSTMEQPKSRDHSYCSLKKCSAIESEFDTAMGMAPDTPTKIVVAAFTDEGLTTRMNSPMDTPEEIAINPSMNHSSDHEAHKSLSMVPTVLGMDYSSNIKDDEMQEVSLCQDEKIYESATTVEYMEDPQGRTRLAVDCASEIPDCSFEFSDVTLTCTTEGTTISIVIPLPWAVHKLVTDKGNFLFSYAITKMENGDNLPVYERNVKLHVNRVLSHYVYGRAVDVHDSSLPSVLIDIESLPQTLETFKNMNICNGIGSINDLYLISDRACKDSVDRWRDKNCTLISRRKRCDHCIKTRTVAVRRQARTRTKEGLKRMSRACNPIDQRKLIALHKKTSRERRLRKRAQARISFLEQRLQNRAAEIAAIRNETLADRCAKLDIPTSQQTVLHQIIAAAGKMDGRNRHYGEEWIMLCLMLNIRSPSTYEFLRKNNVLPLPSSGTIRSYFSAIGMRCGFDEDFAELLKKHFEKKNSSATTRCTLVGRNLSKKIRGRVF
ncbi:uncharacterized protein [Venturia canescens]|uniref:uncharacterized protein n=1 Tax=Venturia canescens TaxID=32260 RepID=UPI001C9C09A9|nr:uncharacterized protein LOC122417834 [Venturia canescens]XP_043287588.1 uncharacterized protein LOC122417834 [Venturia canescens]XP_043287589.1 uncharacterized protein LOC122417834 [Venturia canescens]